ncbi:MAG TPA: hypothetical protein VFF04_00330 [Candidatus Babeliales bacterium]|nr:hypothetical protein [Candidatus Babeliales bacterium]
MKARRKVASRATPAPSPSIVLSDEERMRVVMFFDLLSTIQQRLAARRNAKRKTKITHKEDSSLSSFSRQRAVSFMHILYLFAAALSLLNHSNYLMQQDSMIDTIVLSLNKNMYEITQPDKFQPSARWVLAPNAHNNFIQSKQNPTKKDLLHGIYKPRLTLSNRINSKGGHDIMIKIALSLPKLVHGNNFMELQYKDFHIIVDRLVAVLKTMGVHTTADILTNAPVAAIHYSKNIALTDGSIPYHYLQKIKEANAHHALDVNQTDYRNDGHSYRWHCNSYEIVFYDKIRDLEKAITSSRRAIEQDNEIQLMLAHRFQKRKKLEFLRMEVRLNKRQKMRHLFKKLGIAQNLTFKKLFKPAISKKILLHYMDQLQSRRPLLLDYNPKNSKAFLADLIFNNPTMNHKQILQSIGLKQVLETVTLRELRVMFKCSDRSWYRFLEEMNKIQLPIARNPLKVIREQLEKFKPLKGF